jgi:hypothetical protein
MGQSANNPGAQVAYMQPEVPRGSRIVDTIPLFR